MDPGLAAKMGTDSVHLLFLARQTKPADGQSDLLWTKSRARCNSKKPASRCRDVHLPLTRRASAIQDDPNSEGGSHFSSSAVTYRLCLSVFDVCLALVIPVIECLRLGRT